MKPTPNILSRLPHSLSHWLGHRAIPPSKHPNYIIWIWSFIGAFGGLAVLQVSSVTPARPESLTFLGPLPTFAVLYQTQCPGNNSQLCK